MSETRPSLQEQVFGRPWLSAFVVATVLFVTFTVAAILPGLAVILGYFLITVVVVRLAIAVARRLTRGRPGSSSG